MDQLAPEQEEAIAATVEAIQRIAMAIVALPKEERAAHSTNGAAIMTTAINTAATSERELTIDELEHVSGGISLSYREFKVEYTAQKTT